MKKIIFQNDEDALSIMCCAGSTSIENTAKIDVPTGVKYKIIDDADFPSDREFQDAWEYDFSTDFDGVGE